MSQSNNKSWIALRFHPVRWKDFANHSRLFLTSEFEASAKRNASAMAAIEIDANPIALPRSDVVIKQNGTAHIDDGDIDASVIIIIDQRKASPVVEIVDPRIFSHIVKTI